LIESKTIDRAWFKVHPKRLQEAIKHVGFSKLELVVDFVEVPRRSPNTLHIFDTKEEISVPLLQLIYVFLRLPTDFVHTCIMWRKRVY
jgi:hypothetical protein